MYQDDIKFPDFINTPTFWIENINDSEKIIHNLKKIENFNEKIKLKIPFLHSLDTNGESISGRALTEYIKSYTIPSKDMYDSTGKIVDKVFYDEIIFNTNLDALRDSNPVKYGMSIMKINLRSFPTESAVFSCPEHSNSGSFDRFQETGCNSCEPLLILHESRDRKWYFVMMYNYTGWANAEGIALFTGKRHFLDWAFCNNFLIVTGKEADIAVYDEKASPKTVRCGMSTKLFLSMDSKSDSEENYSLDYPVRGIDGGIQFKRAFISKNEDITVGYLPYTRHNIIEQAFKYLGTPYDWGEKYNGRDCSSFIMTVYRCFGIKLPRNAGEQAESFYDSNNVTVFSREDTLEERYSKIEGLKAGTALFMDGHTMMYLGKYSGNHYMIHTFAGYSIKKGNSFEPRTAMSTFVSPVDLPTSGGRPFIEKFTCAVCYE